MPDIVLKPVGVVRNGIFPAAAPARHDWDDITSDIVLDGVYAAGLDGIEGFSHIIVVFWLHLVTEETRLKVHPRRNAALPLVGVFATRAPVRPNRLGQTAVKLIKRQSNVLTVQGLDAFDGTPVLDIKPYMPAYDAIPDARVAEWAKGNRLRPV